MRRLWLAVSCSLVVVGSASAQSNVEVNAGLQFDFQSPGARSLATGGAFVGLADDATAAFVNPAGLRVLSRMEVSFEGRARDFTIPVVDLGRLIGQPSLSGEDTFQGLRIEDPSQSGGGLSFVSFVYPRSRWSIAAYRHELAHFTTDVRTGGFFGTSAAVAPETDGPRRFPIVGNTDVNIAGYGVSGSFNLNSQVSIGAGLAFYDFHMNSRTDRFDVVNDEFTNPEFYGRANYSTGNIENYQLQEGDDSAVGFNLGALWMPSRKFQLGAVFRQGPDFDLRIANLDPDTDEPFDGFDRQGQFHVPHVFGIGAVMRPFASSTIVFDITRVDYSRLTDDFIDIFNDPDSPDGPYAVRDGTEVHAGFEYFFIRRVPIALRTGYWLDPEHALEYQGQSDPGEGAIFRSRHEDQHHVTFGAGAVFGRFEINGAGDISQRTTTASISAVVRF